MPGLALNTLLAAALCWGSICHAQTPSSPLPALPEGVGAVAPARTASSPDSSALPTPVATRAEAIDLLKQGCPRRAERLMNLAAPEGLADPTVVPGICRCADARLEGSPTSTALDELPELATSDTLACTQPYATSSNQALTRQRFADHLLLQGLTEREMDEFSQCLAEGHWQGSFSALPQGRPTRIKGPVLWADCARKIGHPGIALPAARSTTPLAPAVSTPP